MNSARTQRRRKLLRWLRSGVSWLESTAITWPADTARTSAGGPGSPSSSGWSSSSPLAPTTDRSGVCTSTSGITRSVPGRLSGRPTPYRSTSPTQTVARKLPFSFHARRSSPFGLPFCAPLSSILTCSGAQNGSPKGEDLLAWKLNGNFLATVWVGLVDRYGVGLPDSRPGTDLVIPEVDVHTPDRSVVGARGLDDDHPELEGEPGPPADVLAVSAGHVIAVDSSHDTPDRSHRSSFLL